jgi:hypothetical protein
MVTHHVAKVIAESDYGIDEEIRIQDPLDGFHATKTHLAVERTAKHLGGVLKPVSCHFLPFVNVLGCLEHIEHAFEVFSKAGNFLIVKRMRRLILIGNYGFGTECKNCSG